MLVEGIGVTAPQHVPIVLTANELRCLVTESGVRAEYRGYKARRDQWGKGIKSDLELPGARDLFEYRLLLKGTT